MSRPWVLVAGDFVPGGGMDRANLELACYLAQRRDGLVHIVAHRADDELLQHPNVKFHRVARPMGRHLLGSFLLSRAGRRVARELQPQNPLVVVNGGNCRWPGVNWVHWVHRSYAGHAPEAPVLRRLVARFHRWLNVRQESAAIAACRVAIANSELTRGHLVRDLGVDPDRIRVIYLGVDPDRYRPVSREERRRARAALGFDSETTILLFVGALGFDRRKGFDTLLKAVGRSTALADRPFVLLAAGGGQLAYWQKQIDASGLAARVRLLGSRGDVPDLLAAADLLISPTRYDSYGLNVHEAICRDLPALVTRTAGVAERYPPELADLILQDPDSADELANRIDRWNRRSSDFRGPIAAFGERLRSWTWQHMAAKMVEVIEANA